MSQATPHNCTVRKGVMSSACSSEDYNRSSVKRLFSSVFSIIDTDDSEISSFEQEQTSDRIAALLVNSQFLQQVTGKIRGQGLYDGYNLPILKMVCHFFTSFHTSSQPECCQLDYQDLCQVFARFGCLDKVVLSRDSKEAYVFFNSFVNAYVGYKLLKNQRLRGETIEIKVQWINSNDIQGQIAPHVQLYLEVMDWDKLYCDAHARNDVYIDDFSNEIQYNGGTYNGNQNDFGCMGSKQSESILSQDNQPGFSVSSNLKQNKLTCRYEIQIDNERQFQVARRIIGSKGCNMKKIIEDSINSLKLADENRSHNCDNMNELLKLRLRGKGSGYKEGFEQIESNETLHLCVSAKDENAYNFACSRVQKLLENVYAEYLQFTRKTGKSVELTVKKSNLGQKYYGCVQGEQQKSFDQRQSLEDGSLLNYRISPQKISELLELRNKARRELNFLEADRIRNYLRSRGVCLIDEKGRRGKATDVTTWKYIF